MMEKGIMEDKRMKEENIKAWLGYRECPYCGRREYSDSPALFAEINFCYCDGERKAIEERLKEDNLNY